MFFNLALTTFSFLRNIDNDSWLVSLLRSLCVYCAVGFEYLHITFKIRVTCCQYRSTNTSWRSSFLYWFCQKDKRAKIRRIKKSLSDIGEFSTQQYFPRLCKHPVLRHCPGNAKLSCWKGTIKSLALYTRINRYVGPLPVSLLGALAKFQKGTVSCTMSARLSVCPHLKTRTHRADIH